MFIIIEGSDGTGKSTLASFLAKRIQHDDPDSVVELIHRGPPQRDVLEEYAFDVDGYRPNCGRHIIADRWHLGTLVYAKLYRDMGDYGELGLGGFRWVDLFLRSRGACLWLVDHPVGKVRERLAARGEDYLKDEHLEWCLERFREVALWSSLYYETVDTTRIPKIDLAKDIIRRARFAAWDASRLYDYPGYVGGTIPHTVLVGERHGGRPPHRSQSAFIPTGANSGRFLLESLPDPFWRGVGLVNAYETNVASLLNVFDIRPTVVALGTAAHVELNRQGVMHAKVPHPQYIRRFHNSQRERYGEMIVQASKSGEEIYTWQK